MDLGSADSPDKPGLWIGLSLGLNLVLFWISWECLAWMGSALGSLEDFVFRLIRLKYGAKIIEFRERFSSGK